MTHAIFFASFFMTSLAALGLSPYEMVKKADAFRFPSSDLSFVVKVSDLTDGNVDRTTHYKVQFKYKDKNPYSISEAIFPERQKGRKLLMRGNDLWIYLPTVKRPTRISFREKLTGEVSNGDIAKTNYAEDYTAVLVGTEKVNNFDCQKLLLTGKNLKEVTYAKITYWIKSDNFMPVKAEYHAISGKLLKSAIFSDLKPMLASKYLTKMTITDALTPKKQSVLIYSDYKNESFQESLFNKDSLNQ
jgi:hypothetical protein